MPEFSAGDPAPLHDFLDEDTYIAAFQQSYIEAALWTGVVSEDSEVQEVLDATFDQLDGDAIVSLNEDAENFVRSNIGLLIRHALWTMQQPRPDWSADITGYMEIAAAQAGHDFWLTRNGHGAGFWDRGMLELGDMLSNCAKVYGEAHLWLDAEGVIHAG